MTEIDVTFRMNSENTTCPICYSTVKTPLLQCHNALHFVCLTCLKSALEKAIVCNVRQAECFITSFLKKIHSEKAIEAHLSPKGSHFADVNVLGMDFLYKNRVFPVPDWDKESFVLQ